MAELLGVERANVSRIERRADLLRSTLARKGESNCLDCQGVLECF
jgi:hypothetical protein